MGGGPISDHERTEPRLTAGFHARTTNPIELLKHIIVTKDQQSIYIPFWNCELIFDPLSRTSN
jgi:hypothetical protein